jgi:hypothetical protein
VLRGKGKSIRGGRRLAAGDDLGQGGWGAGRDGGVDGDLVVLLVVDQFQAERGEHAALDGDGQIRQGVTEHRQDVQQAGVVLVPGGPCQGGKALVDLGALGF